MTKMIVINKNKKLINSLLSSFLSICILFIISKLLDKYNFLNLFVVLIIVESSYLFIKSRFNTNLIRDTFLKTRFTAFLAYYSSAIISFEYSTYKYDWLLIGVGANKRKDPTLYVTDYQASIEHPHMGAHILINSLNDSEIFSEIFYFLFLIQTHIFALIFLTIFKILKNRNELFADNQIIYVAPFLTIPFISGLHTILPWFLPSISGFVLSSLAVITYVYNRNFIYIYLVLFSLIFVHPFWAALTPVILLVLQLMEKRLFSLDSLGIIILLIGPFYLLPPGSISIVDFFALVQSDFFYITKNTHVFWFSRQVLPVKTFFFFPGLYQGILNLLILILYFVNIKNVRVFSNSAEKNILSILTVASFISFLSIFFQSTIFHEILTTVNFYRIKGLNWIFLPLLLSQVLNKNNRNFLLYFIFLGSYIVSFGSTNLIGLFFLIFLLFTFIEKKENNIFNPSKSVIFISLNVFLYFTIEQHFSFFNIIFITVLIIKYEIELPRISLAPIFLTFCICISYLGFTSITKTFNIEGDKCFDETSIQQIQNYVSKEDIVITKPSMDCFRRDTKRSQIFSTGFLPYNIEQGDWYLNQLNEFEKWEKLPVDRILDLVKKNNATHLLLNIEHSASKEFLKNYEFITVRNTQLKQYYYLFNLSD